MFRCQIDPNINALWPILSALTGEHLAAMPYVERLPRLRQLCPELHTVGFNGQTSGKFAPQFAAEGYRTVVLPSTSPAHASLTLVQKVQQWQALVLESSL